SAIAERPGAPRTVPQGSVEVETSRPRVWPYLAGGVGVAAAGVGTLLLLSARSDRDRLRHPDLDPTDPTGTIVRSPSLAEAVRLEGSANTKAGVGTVLAVVGGALVVGSFLWLLTAGN